MGEAARQIAFDLGHRAALGREDFLIAPSNQDAVAWIDLWPDWPAPALVLYGPVASGKTHLAAVWRERARAYNVSREEMIKGDIRDIAGKAKHIVIDDADRLIGALAGEKSLFHLYNLSREEKRSLLITLEEPPVRRAFALRDLASRLRAAPAVAIREPDDQLLSAVLVKLFSDRQLRIGEDVLNYILRHMERSFEAARDIAEAADHKALSEKRPISVPLVRELLLR